MTAPRDAFVDVGGLRLHSLDWGTAGLSPLVCLHGITQTAHSWDEVAPALAVTHHVPAPEAAERLASIAHAEVRTVAGAGHSVMGDNPAGFLAAVQPFLASLPPS